MATWLGGRVGAGVGVGEVAKKRELGNIINIRFEPGSAAAEIKNWRESNPGQLRNSRTSPQAPYPALV